MAPASMAFVFVAFPLWLGLESRPAARQRLPRHPVRPSGVAGWASRAGLVAERSDKTS